MIATLVALGGACSAAPAAAPVAAGPAAANQVERGRYLVKTTGCNDCHTPGYIESAGRVEESRWLVGNSLGWQGPLGTTYPANLRLVAQGLTADQWLMVARRQMRPPMPWFALREMTDAELLAIYYFTRSLGPAGSDAPAFIPPGKLAQTPVVKIPG
jgi:mono/diheme cytochrome c family protein